MTHPLILKYAVVPLCAGLVAWGYFGAVALVTGMFAAGLTLFLIRPL